MYIDYFSQYHYQFTNTRVHVLIESNRLLNSIINSQVHINFNIVCHTGCCGYIHDVTITICAQVKMYITIY